MARPKKTTTKKTTSTRGRKPATKATPKKATAKSPSGDAIIKMLKSTGTTKRPPDNPDMPQHIITMLNEDLNSIKELLDNFAKHLRSLDRCPKAYGFWTRSLRITQTPHINSWSFAKGKTPKLSGVAG